MKRIAKAAIAVSVVVAILAVAAWLAYGRLEDEFQKSADAKRVNDVHKISDLFDAYQARAGHVPLGDQLKDGESITAIIGREGLEANQATLGNPLGPEPPLYRAADLLGALRRVLGPAVELPIDPQRAATGAPISYYVRFKPGGRYIVAAFLRRPRANTTKLAEGVFAYALRSKAGGESAWPIWNNARIASEVSSDELITIRAAGDEADRRFGRYMETARR